MKLLVLSFAIQGLLLCAGLLSSSSRLAAEEGTGLKISAAVDLVGSYSADKKSSADDAFGVREAEILLTAPIDQTFKGVLSFAAHQEEGESVAEVHEAYISTSNLIPRSNIRIGQFFLGVGRLNQFHRHEWPFIFAPKVHEEFFGEEGALDSGVEYSFLAPLPFYLEATAGVTNGFNYGHAHDEGEKPRQPTHYGRLATYFELPGDGGAQTAVNYLSRTDAQNNAMTLTGLDFTAKWRQAGLFNVLVQGEVWHRTQTLQDAASEKSLGAYVFPQYAIDTQLFVGAMVQYYSILTLEDGVGNKIDNSTIGYVPTITYKASEFSTLRLAYDRSTAHRDDQSDKTEQKIEVQATFIIGAHPAHDF